MNSSKEAKSALKAQKKNQKASKKQQKQNQLQQQKQQLANGINAGNSKSPLNAKPGVKSTTNQHFKNNNNSNTVQNNNTSKNSVSSTTASQKLKNENNGENPNNATASRITETVPILPDCENIPKMERSNSFSLRNSFSKVISQFTGSKENLSKTDKDGISKTPFTFSRSRSMILLRRPNRRSFVESPLEQLSEETEKSADSVLPPTPNKTQIPQSRGQDVAPYPPLQDERLTNFEEECSVQLRQRANTSSMNLKSRTLYTPTRRQSELPLTSTPLEEDAIAHQRKASLVSLTPVAPNFNPQRNFQTRRSNTLIASFKSTFGGLTGGGGEKKKEKMNPKWSASLQSLQAIDNMVSYANMSFIDYDKFHGYEKQLEYQQMPIESVEQPDPVITPLTKPIVSVVKVVKSPGTPSCPVSQETTPKTVMRRRQRSTNSLHARQASSHTSLINGYNLDTNYEHNLDRGHNVYRESLDSRTLEMLNQPIKKQSQLIDALALEDGSAGQQRTFCAQRFRRENSIMQRDAVDGEGKLIFQVSPLFLDYKTVNEDTISLNLNTINMLMKGIELKMLLKI